MAENDVLKMMDELEKNGVDMKEEIKEVKALVTSLLSAKVLTFAAKKV